MEEPEFATVQLRVRLQDTVGDFKKAVTEEAQNLFYKDRKLEKDSEKLQNVGVGPESLITNGPISKKNKMFFDRLSVNNCVKLIYGILSIVRIPRIQRDPNSSHPLCSLALRPGLEAIINELDILSFSRFTSTCKWLRSFSLSNSALRVYTEATISASMHWNPLQGQQLRIHFLFEDYELRSRLLSAIQLNNLRKLPLELLTELNLQAFWRDLTPAMLNEISEYIKQFRRIQITKITVARDLTVNCWPEFFHFIKTHSIKHVTLECSNTMSDEQFEYILRTGLEYLQVEGHLPREMFRRLRVDAFNLRQSALTVDEFKEILQLLAYGKIDKRVKKVSLWGFQHIHSDFSEPDTFVDCFEYFTQLPFDYEGDLPETRPIISQAINRYEQTQIYLVSESNKVFIFTNRSDYIQIRLEHPGDLYDGPEMFRCIYE